MPRPYGTKERFQEYLGNTPPSWNEITRSSGLPNPRAIKRVPFPQIPQLPSDPGDPAPVGEKQIQIFGKNISSTNKKRELETQGYQHVYAQTVSSDEWNAAPNTITARQTIHMFRPGINMMSVDAHTPGTAIIAQTEVELLKTIAINTGKPAAYEIDVPDNPDPNDSKYQKKGKEHPLYKKDRSVFSSRERMVIHLACEQIVAGGNLPIAVKTNKSFGLLDAVLYTPATGPQSHKFDDRVKQLFDKEATLPELPEYAPQVENKIVITGSTKPEKRKEIKEKLKGKGFAEEHIIDTHNDKFSENHIAAMTLEWDQITGHHVSEYLKFLEDHDKQISDGYSYQDFLTEFNLKVTPPKEVLVLATETFAPFPMLMAALSHAIQHEGTKVVLVMPKNIKEEDEEKIDPNQHLYESVTTVQCFLDLFEGYFPGASQHLYIPQRSTFKDELTKAVDHAKQFFGIESPNKHTNPRSSRRNQN
jgi:hypothetical protein